MTIKLRHIGLVVDDLELMKEFYISYFGFALVYDHQETGSFIDKILSMTDVNARIIKMSLPNEECLLELLKFNEGQKPTGEQSIFRSGFSHIALTVTDVDRLYRCLKQDGVICLSEPCDSPDKRARVVFCRDPEGNFIELVQELG